MRARATPHHTGTHTLPEDLHPGRACHPGASVLPTTQYLRRPAGRIAHSHRARCPTALVAAPQSYNRARSTRTVACSEATSARGHGTPVAPPGGRTPVRAWHPGAVALLPARACVHACVAPASHRIPSPVDCGGPRPGSSAWECQSRWQSLAVAPRPWRVTDHPAPAPTPRRTLSP